MPDRDARDRRSAAEPGLERVLEAYFEHGPDGVLLTQPDGTVLRANPAACAMLGRTEAELGALGRDGVLVPAPAAAALLAARERNGKAQGELTLRRADGTTFPAAVTSAIVLAEGGEHYSVVQFRDLTEARRAEAALREREALYRSLFTLAPGGVFLVGLDGRLEAFNDQAAAQLGYTREEFARLQIWDIDAEDDRAQVMVRVDQILRDGRAEFDTRQRRKDGALRDVHVRAVRVDGGPTPWMLSFIDDVTEARRLERAVQAGQAERDEHGRWLLASQRVARLGHYVFEIAANRWTSSAVLDEIFGIGPEHQRDAGTWLALIHPDDRPGMAAYLQELLASGTRFDRVYRVGAEGAPLRWVHGLGDLERDAAGQPVRLFGTIQDVTARLEADRAREALADQLRQAQKLESIGRLAGGVAHDFNNILVVVMTCADGLQRSLLEGRPPEAEDVEEIQAAARRARDLTAQLLAFARRQVVAPVALDLNEAVRRAERLLHRLLGEDVALELRLEPEPGIITCDPGQLQQVLMNLAVNARDAMPSGGRLILSTATLDQPGATPAGWTGLEPPPGRYVRLLVEDSGVGIPAELRPRIFEPFVTSKPQGKGTGLGLATVYGIVRQAGGAIRFRSEEGQGTAFELLWPCSVEPPVAAVAGPERQAGPSPRPSGRILVVEDDDLVREATTRALGAAGYQVTAASGGTEALALLERGLAPPQLLLTDVVMPGMNGRQVADAVRAVVPGLRVLFMSGYAGDIIVHHGVVEPGLDLLEKPFTSAVLLERVQAALQG